MIAQYILEAMSKENMGLLGKALEANPVIPTSLDVPYTVFEGFDDSNGKFPNTLGNVAIIDCHSVSTKLST